MSELCKIITFLMLGFRWAYANMYEAAFFDVNNDFLV